MSPAKGLSFMPASAVSMNHIKRLAEWHEAPGGAIAGRLSEVASLFERQDLVLDREVRDDQLWAVVRGCAGDLRLWSRHGSF